MVKRILLLSIVCLVFISATTLQAAELHSRTDRSQVGINESVTLELTAVGSLDGDPDFSVLKDNFEIVGQSQSSQVQIINGDYSKSKVWTLTLLPQRSGTLIIPALCSGSDCSKPTAVIVREQKPSDMASAKVILEAEVSSFEVIAQQQLIYTIRLLFRQPLLQAGLGDLSPEGVETTVHLLGEDVHYETERGSWRYKVIERNYALFPQHAGQLHLPPLRFNGQVQDNNGSRFNSRFDSFRQGGHVIRLRTDAIDITITEPPATPPQQPWLPASKFLIGDDWQHTPPTLTVGEPATRTIITTATGLAAAQLPEIIIFSPESFKVYPDQTLRRDQLEATGIRGIMEQKVAIVPTKAGTFTLPALQLKWWDIGSKKWRTQQTKEVTVQVLPAQRDASPAVNVNVPDQPTPPKSPTIVPAPALDTAAAKDSPAQPLWMWISALCVVGWGITLLLLLRSRKQQQQKVTSAEHETVSAAVPQSKARDEVVRCARGNEAAATRIALLVWIHAIAPLSDIESFTQQVKDPLQQQILGLNRALYSANGMETWRGEELAQAIENWSEDNNNKPQSSLPDFYPKG